MLIVYKKKSAEDRYADYFFDSNIKSFNLSSEVSSMILQVMDKVIVGQGTLASPYGIITPKDLSSPCKLAMCLVNYPGFVFKSGQLRAQDMEKILKLPTGQLQLTLTEPIPYLYEVNIKTGDSYWLRTSTDINVWYFKKDTNISFDRGSIERVHKTRNEAGTGLY
jgi:hypothetical protein